MAGQGWGTDDSVVEKDLFQGARRFDFFQAVRLLEMLRQGAPRPGEGSEPDEEPVRLRASMDMSFAPSEVLALSRGEGQECKRPPVLTVSVPGLAGARGPLPLPVSQWVRDRERRGDTGPRDFLDLFHHRLLALRYRARMARRLALEPRPPEKHMVASWLFALMGLGTAGLRGQGVLSERVLLRYAGALARRPRSMATLEAVLRDYFGVEVKGRSFEGAWLPLDEVQRTRLGRTGRNQRLGEAVLGRRVWDWQARFRLTLGPLSRKQFESFLPGERGLAELAELVRFMVGPAQDFHLELVVEPPEVPTARLGQARLGWSSWLPTYRHDDWASVAVPKVRNKEGRVTLSARYTRAPLSPAGAAR